MQNTLTQTHLAAKKREERIELGFHVALAVVIGIICFSSFGALLLEIAKAAR